MSKYVCNGATCRCSEGGTCNLIVSSQNAVRGNSLPLATETDCSIGNLPSFIMCKSLQNPAVQAANGSPVPCQSPPLQKWEDTSEIVKIRGKKALLESSKIKCAYSGEITIVSPNCSIRDNANVSIPSVPPIIPVVQKPEEKEAESEQENVEGLLCPGCDKKETCGYLKASTEVNNNSGLLRRNFDKSSACDAIDDYILDQMIAYHKWTFAAHHIISGMQVFKKFPELVRLANFSGYDINNALNCILLVSKQDEYGKQNPFMQDVSAYNAMSQTGIQWHLGGHSYKFTKEEIANIKKIEYLAQQKITNGLKCYADLLMDELNKIQYALEQHKVCRDTPQQKAAICKRLNNLSQKIKNKLGAFRNKHRDSFPYYVSKDAFDFTFNLPRTEKLIIVRPVGNALKLTRYRLERYIKNENERVVLKPILDKDNTNELIFKSNIEECICFCQNIRHFVYLPNVLKSNIRMPFKPEYIHYPHYSFSDDIALLNYRENHLMVWLRDNQADEYIAPLKLIKLRMKEAGM